MKKSYWLIVFLVALLARMALFAAINSTDKLLFLDYDSYGYMRIAHNLLQYNFFSQGDLNYLYSFVPDPQRTPLYPLFIELILGLKGDYPEVILFQVLLSSLTAALTAQLIYKISKSNIIALLAGIVVALDISSIHMAAKVMTETWFSFVFTIFLFALIHFVESKKVAVLLVGGVLLGILLLIRPIATYLPFVLALAALFMQLDLKKKLLYSALLITIPFLVASPWYYRNYKTFGTPFLSIIKEINLIYCTTRAIRMRSEHLSYQEFKAIYDEKLMEDYDNYGNNYVKDFLEFAPAETWKYIKKEPLLFVRNTVESLILNVAMPDNIDGMIYYFKNKNWQQLPEQQHSLDFFTLAKAFSIKTVNALLLLFAWVGFLVSFHSWWQQKRIPPQYAVLLLIWLYFVVISAPSGTVLRFRIPLWPVWLALGIPGIQLLIGQMKKSRIWPLRKPNIL